MKYKEHLNLAQQILAIAGAESLSDDDPDTRIYSDRDIVIMSTPDELVEVWVSDPPSDVTLCDRPCRCVLRGYPDSIPDVYRPDYPYQWGWVNTLENLWQQLQPRDPRQPLIDKLHHQLGTRPERLRDYIVQLTQLKAMGLEIATWLLSLLEAIARSEQPLQTHENCSNSPQI